MALIILTTITRINHGLRLRQLSVEQVFFTVITTTSTILAIHFVTNPDLCPNSKVGNAYDPAWTVVNILFPATWSVGGAYQRTCAGITRVSYTRRRCSWWGSVLEERDWLRLRCGVTSAPIMLLRFSRSTVERWNTSTIGELRFFGGLISKSSSLWTGLTESWGVLCSTALCHVSYQCPLHTLQGN